MGWILIMLVWILHSWGGGVMKDEYYNPALTYCTLLALSLSLSISISHTLRRHRRSVEWGKWRWRRRRRFFSGAVGLSFLDDAPSLESDDPPEGSFLFVVSGCVGCVGGPAQFDPSVIGQGGGLDGPLMPRL